MVKFVIILFFFALIGSCSFNHNPNHNSSPNSESLFSAEEKHIKLPNKKDFPFIKPLSNKELVILKTQIKDNPLLIKQLSANQVLNLLGTPIIIKKQTDIEIWQFRNKCILNIIWKKHKNPTSYYLSSINNIINNTLDSNFTIIWINSITSDRKPIPPDKCFLETVNFKQGYTHDT